MSGSHLCIPRNETVISKSEIKCSVCLFYLFLHSYICKRFIYFQDRSDYFAAGKYVDRSWEYINRSQTHECGNWDWGRAIHRKGIHIWDYRCSAVGLVCPVQLEKTPSRWRPVSIVCSEWFISINNKHKKSETSATEQYYQSRNSDYSNQQTLTTTIETESKWW
jgi:hypothetical protein